MNYNAYLFSQIFHALFVKELEHLPYDIVYPVLESVYKHWEATDTLYFSKADINTYTSIEIYLEKHSESINFKIKNELKPKEGVTFGFQDVKTEPTTKSLKLGEGVSFRTFTPNEGKVKFTESTSSRVLFTNIFFNVFKEDIENNPVKKPILDEVIDNYYEKWLRMTKTGTGFYKGLTIDILTYFETAKFYIKQDLKVLFNAESLKTEPTPKPNEEKVRNTAKPYVGKVKATTKPNEEKVKLDTKPNVGKVKFEDNSDNRKLFIDKFKNVFEIVLKQSNLDNLILYRIIQDAYVKWFNEVNSGSSIYEGLNVEASITTHLYLNSVYDEIKHKINGY